MTYKSGLVVENIIVSNQISKCKVEILDTVDLQVSKSIFRKTWANLMMVSKNVVEGTVRNAIWLHMADLFMIPVDVDSEL